MKLDESDIKQLSEMIRSIKVDSEQYEINELKERLLLKDYSLQQMTKDRDEAEKERDFLRSHCAKLERALERFLDAVGDRTWNR